MLRIVCATQDDAAFTKLTEYLRREVAIELIEVHSAAAAKEVLSEQQAGLLIAAEQLEDSSGLDCVRQVAAQFPLVHTALCSMRTPEEFHAATEGLGVLLQLPPQPSRSDGKRILERMEQIEALLDASPVPGSTT